MKDLDKEQEEFFMDDIVTAICLRNGDAYDKAKIIRKAVSEQFVLKQELSRLLEEELNKLIPHTERQQILAGHTKTFDKKPIYKWVDYIPKEVIDIRLAELKKELDL